MFVFSKVNKLFLGGILLIQGLLLLKGTDGGFKMAQFCPKCYGKKFMTVRLQEKGNGEYVCTQDASHKFVIDKDGFPRSKKD